MHIKIISTLIVACLLLTSNVRAQEDSDSKKKSISLGTEGISIKSETRTKETGFSISFGVIDLGLNTIQDKTDYNSAAAKGFLNVPSTEQNENLFNLRGGKSWNVNVWPVLAGWSVGDGDKQKVVIGTGVGLQMYNFRFNKPVTYVNATSPEVYLDSVRTFTKNKLGLTYLSVPLMLTFKTKASKKSWLVYGVGVTGGYRIASWMKQITKEDGKKKDHNKFNLNDFNTCVTAEFGLSGYFRLYASYQLTALHDNALVQHPLSIGIRFGGV